jgi:hypothetical protein
LKKLRRRIVALVLLFLPCCVAASAAEVAPGDGAPATARIDAELASVTIEPASRGRAVYPLPSTLGLFLPVWRAALQDALERTGIFRAGAPRRLALEVKVLEFALSGQILDVLARYQLFDVASHTLVFSADIMSNQGISGLAVGVTSLEDPAVATSHRTEVNRAIEANIVQFLDQLEVFARSQTPPAPPGRP